MTGPGLDPDGPPLTAPEVAVLFRVDPKTVVRWANAGVLPSFRTPGRHRRFYRADIIPLLKTGTGKPEGAAT
jgi:excisionase family DNA binding protein